MRYVGLHCFGVVTDVPKPLAAGDTTPLEMLAFYTIPDADHMDDNYSNQDGWAIGDEHEDWGKLGEQSYLISKDEDDCSAADVFYDPQPDGNNKLSLDGKPVFSNKADAVAYINSLMAAIPGNSYAAQYYKTALDELK